MPKKQHGLVVAYKSEYFQLTEKKEFFYDEIPTLFSGRAVTKNTAVIMAIEIIKSKTKISSSENTNKTEESIIDKEEEENTQVSKKVKLDETAIVTKETTTTATTSEPKVTANNEGLIIATTHLYWHPYGSFERALQFGQLVQETLKFSRGGANNIYKSWPIVLGGDFNSSPDDLPYDFLIRQPQTPQQLSKRSREIAEKSLTYLHSKLKFTLINDKSDKKLPYPKDEVVEIEEPDGIISKLKEDYITKCIASILPLYSLKDQKLNTQDHDDNNNEKASSSETSEFSVESLYGSYYHLVDEENSKAHIDIDGCREPEFSNWAHAWRGLLDYIFLFQDKETLKQDPSKNVAVKELLKMPQPKDMGEEPSGQPRVGEYPSDHLCLMATIEI